MYLEHFGLQRQPFKITPDTSLFYSGSRRGAALHALKYAVVSGEGIIKVVGEVGCGKTMICRMLEIELPENIEVVYIANPGLSAEEILQNIALELNIGLSANLNKVEVMHKLHSYLLERHSIGKQVVVFIEEAQCMPVETLEEVRLLSNLETASSKLLQMILFGQPELDEKLRDPVIRQLKERITHSFYLEPFASGDIYEYLNFRMRAVGYRGPDIFNKRIANKIEKKSKGLTRRINIIADKALLAAFSDGDHGVDKSHILIAAKDSDFGQVLIKNSYLSKVAVILLVVIAFMAGSIVARNNVYENTEAVNKENTELLVAESKLEELEIEDYISTRLKETLTWMNNIKKEKFSIQLAIVKAKGKDELIRLLNSVKNELNDEEVYIYKGNVRGNEIYSVLYSAFEDWTSARKQLSELPGELKSNQPYIRNISDIRSNLN